MADPLPCRCDICRAKQLSRELKRHVDPLELMYGIDTPHAFYVRKYPDEWTVIGSHKVRKVWVYDEFKRAHEYHGREVTREEARALTPSQYEAWKASRKGNGLHPSN